ncbi:helix-turn-helix transcriptional regulator [Shimazuella sp. AN120528]|uniref:helix-turn-helix transcriptional regulator n=1 Tax=Shimazuella soli TaxID=1892854 RepID=UPI001F0D4C74|nr:helix-turn-helix transcriptional regulator [Shimazuella soli]MCH5583515.1 helix-turn-helix transcriptional regulator [Shimazuella soli]
MQENKNIKVLGEFLKSRRANVSPEGLQVSIGSRKRRTPGLRREEVAYLSGVSNTWYTWLEQGRDVNVSREVLASIAKTLQLNEEEQRHIFRLGGYPVFAPSQPLEHVINQELQLVVDSIPYPTFIVGFRTDIIAWNDLYALIFPVDFTSQNEKHRNMTWLIFMNEQVRKQIVNWEEFAQYTVGVFRSYYDQNEDDPWFQSFAKELLEKSPEFAAWWEDHPIKQKSEVHLKIRSRDGENIVEYRIVSFFQINGEENVHCCVYTPVAKEGNLAKYEQNKAAPPRP